MKFKILIFLSFILTSLQAQEDTDKNKFISIGISPFSLLELKTSTLVSVLEIKPINNLSIELKYGYPAGLTPERVENRLYDYYELRAGVRYWPYRNFINVGLEYFHVNHLYEKSNSYFRENGNYISYQQAEVVRKVNGGRLRVGFNHSFKSGLTIEYFWGLGIRNVDISYQTVENPQLISGNFLPREEWFPQPDRDVGDKNKPDFHTGLKISWRIFNW